MNIYLVLFYIIIFLMGISWGSFLNVWIYRIPQGRSFAKGRSECMTCKHQLSKWDLVPLFSFIFLKGKCRYCKVKLSWQYPAIEFISGILFVLTFYLFGFNYWMLTISFVLITINLVIAKIDFNTTLIPDVLVIPAIFIGIIYAIFSNRLPITNVPISNMNGYLITGFISFSIFVFLYFISNGGMGIGDAKFVLFMGLFLGPIHTLLALMIGNGLAVIYYFVIKTIYKERLNNINSVTISYKDKIDKPNTENNFMGLTITNGNPSIVLGPFLALAMLVLWYFGIYIY